MYTAVQRQNYIPTLCWKCKNAVGGCMWSKYFIPEEGWDAIPTLIKSPDYGQDGYEESFIVLRCPKYEKG